jgi:hypothetical protein
LGFEHEKESWGLQATGVAVDQLLSLHRASGV